MRLIRPSLKWNVDCGDVGHVVALTAKLEIGGGRIFLTFSCEQISRLLYPSTPSIVL